MIDIRALRAAPEALDQALARRGLAPMAERLLALDALWREEIDRLESAQAERNAFSRQAGEARRAGDEAEFRRLGDAASAARDRISVLQEQVRHAKSRLDEILATVPNYPFDDVPDGETENDNAELRVSGTIADRPYPPRQHYELGEALGLMDFELASTLSGSRFVVLRGAIARLHQALGRFMLDTHCEDHGYEEIWVPSLVLTEIPFATGQLPKFEDDLYQTTRGHWLIPTAEVPLTNLVRDRIVEVSELPLRFVAWTPCFRAEAGAAGQDTRGMLRQHQFEKVEMVSVVSPDQSAAELERMTRCAEAVLTALELPYRVVSLCTGDLGFAARKTYDIEVWLPGQNRYREISSCSNCGDFQARRMHARYRAEPGARPQFLHSLNGSGVAIGRALIAVMENGQTEDGGVDLPAALAPYMRGARRIEPDGSLATDRTGA